MNPFTESTVARPLAQNAASHSTVTADSGRKRKRRSLVGLTLGAMGLATSLGMPPAAGLPATAGALLARAGILAAVMAPGMAHAVDVNSATHEQLRGVRGIGPKTAQIIIEERTRGGKYESFEDLSDRVKGIGPKKVASLQASGLTLSGHGGAPLLHVAPQQTSVPAEPARGNKPQNPPKSRLPEAAKK